MLGNYDYGMDGVVIWCVLIDVGVMVLVNCSVVVGFFVMGGFDD